MVQIEEARDLIPAGVEKFEALGHDRVLAENTRTLQKLSKGLTVGEYREKFSVT